MISWLISRFANRKGSQDEETIRYSVCRLLGYVGIFLNTVLFACKYLIGFLTGSVAIKADAINNLTDSMSNVVSILSFHFAEKPADKEHPFGHERTETIAALFMGAVIVYLGIEMLRQSVQKIIKPSPVHFEWASVLVLVISIAIKLYMYSYNRKFGKIYHSSLLEANAVDSRNDTYGTILVLASTLISPLIGYDLDGITGVIGAGIIFFSAYGLLRDVISNLLGEAPSDEMVNELVDRMMENPVVIDVHDIAVHIYGPRYRYATAHAEVDGEMSLMDAHAQIDAIERHIMEAMNIELVIHIDPVLLNDRATIEALAELENAIGAVNPDWTFQDFRVENREGGKRFFYFDLIVPYDEQKTLEEIKPLLLEQLSDPDDITLKMRLVHPYS